MRLAILASGEGTVFQSIIEHIRLGILKGVEPAILICNRPGAAVLTKADKLGVESRLITRRREDGSKKSFEEFEDEIIEALRKAGVDVIFLAGWDKILNKTVDEYQYKILNTHPSLLPAFAGLYGLEVHKAVIERGCKVSGCTIHYIDKGVDTGPIILQRAVSVAEDDTPESLAEKVKRVEQLLAPMALQLHVDGRISLVNRSGKVVTYVEYTGGWLEEWEERQKRYLELKEEGKALG